MYVLTCERVLRTDARGPVGGESVSRPTDTVETTEEVDTVAVSTDTGHLSTLVHV